MFTELLLIHNSFSFDVSFDRSLTFQFFLNFVCIFCKFKLEMDGEKYLIKIVKLNPAIWNKKLYEYADNELKNIIWLKLAKKFNMDGEFLPIYSQTPN